MRKLDLARRPAAFRDLLGAIHVLVAPCCFPADPCSPQLLIYLILFISDCLSRIAGARVPMSQNEASKQLQSLSVDNFSLPGDASFPLNNLYQPPASRAEAGESRWMEVC